MSDLSSAKKLSHGRPLTDLEDDRFAPGESAANKEKRALGSPERQKKTFNFLYLYSVLPDFNIGI